MEDEISDFADDPYLINVAVSRAKHKMCIRDRNRNDRTSFSSGCKTGNRRGDCRGGCGGRERKRRAQRTFQL